MTDEQNRSFSISDRGSVASVQSFVESFFRLRSEIGHRKLLLRGQSKSTDELRPTVGRPAKYFGETKNFDRYSEIDLLHRFRRRAFPHFGRHVTAGEALFLARHHGLPTRLLDWTANALFALYFSCCNQERRTEVGIVYAIVQTSDTDHINPYEVAKIEDENEVINTWSANDGEPAPGRKTDHWIKIVHPIFSSPRIVAQDSAFTLHSNPQTDVKKYRDALFWPNHLDVEMLFHWQIPANAKAQIVADLSGLGITQRAVFPDLDGIAKSIWETDVLWSRRR